MTMESNMQIMSARTHGANMAGKKHSKIVRFIFVRDLKSMCSILAFDFSAYEFCLRIPSKIYHPFECAYNQIPLGSDTSTHSNMTFNIACNT